MERLHKSHFLLRSSDPKKLLNSYSPTEEKLHVWSHAIGLGLSVIGLVLLVIRALDSENGYLLISCVIFGASMILLYAASTCTITVRKGTCAIN